MAIIACMYSPLMKARAGRVWGGGGGINLPSLEPWKTKRALYQTNDKKKKRKNKGENIEGNVSYYYATRAERRETHKNDENESTCNYATWLKTLLLRAIYW